MAAQPLKRRRRVMMPRCAKCGEIERGARFIRIHREVWTWCPICGEQPFKAVQSAKQTRLTP